MYEHAYRSQAGAESHHHSTANFSSPNHPPTWPQPHLRDAPCGVCHSALVWQRDDGPHPLSEGAAGPGAAVLCIQRQRGALARGAAHVGQRQSDDGDRAVLTAASHHKVLCAERCVRCVWVRTESRATLKSVSEYKDLIGCTDYVSQRVSSTLKAVTACDYHT